MLELCIKAARGKSDDALGRAIALMHSVVLRPESGGQPNYYLLASSTAANRIVEELTDWFCLDEEVLSIGHINLEEGQTFVSLLHEDDPKSVFMLFDEILETMVIGRINDLPRLHGASFASWLNDYSVVFVIHVHRHFEEGV